MRSIAHDARVLDIPVPILMSPTEPHLLFVAMYHGDAFAQNIVRVSRHINASSDSPVHFHAVVNVQIAALPTWCTQWPITRMPEDTVARHRNLTRGKPHGAYVFLWKPFLYKLVMLDKVIVLDLDVALVGPVGIRGLWSEFDAFSQTQVIGLAKEQGPTYARVRPTHVGVNGGVQLQDLERMRFTASEHALGASPSYEETLGAYAAGEFPGWDAVQPALGDQTLYTRLCNRQPHLCRIVPCGWNRQLSTTFFSVSNFQSEWHNCSSSCELLHFNQPLLEGLVPELQPTKERLTCSDCRRGIERLINLTREHPTKNPRFTWGASKQYMGSVIENCCCKQELAGGGKAA